MTIAAIVGPTAAGKSAIAEAVARTYHAAIISIDSMQVYFGMDIGTAKPDRSVRQWVDYRMVDVCDPAEQFSAHSFQHMARRHIEELAIQHRRVVIAGGSGLHFRAVVDPMTFAPTDPGVREELEETSDDLLVADLLDEDPDAGSLVDMANRRRVIRALEIIRLTGRTPTQRVSSPEANRVRRYDAMYPFEAIGVDARSASSERVASRLDAMVDAGLFPEVEGLQGKLGVSASRAIGYREIARALGGEIGRQEAIADTLRATNALVKRQRTFFRRDPRIEWLAWQDDDDRRIEEAVSVIGEKMQWTS